MARLAVALALALGLAACKTVAHGDVFEEQIGAQLEAEGKPAEVECPDRIPLGQLRDNHFDCVLIWQQTTRIPVLVELDDKGAWRMHAK